MKIGFKRWRWIAIGGLPLVFGLGYFAHRSIGTRTVRSGAYGPFRIGETKAEALDTLSSLGIRSVGPGLDNPIYLWRPGTAQILAMQHEDAVTVWLDGDYWPLHVIFSDGMVARTSPVMKRNGHESPEAGKRLALYGKLQSSLEPGLTESEALQRIAQFGAQNPIDMSNAIPVWDESLPSKESLVASGLGSGPYRDLLLHYDKWRFDGLREEVWYRPYYSNVSLSFKDGRLQRVDHWVFPFELP